MSDNGSILSSIRPQLEELESWRLQLKEKAKTSLYWGLPLLAGGLLVLIFSPFGAVFLIAGILVIAITYGVQASKYKKEFKARVLPVIVDGVQPGIHYSPKNKIPISDFRHSELFLQRVDRYRGEDYFRGNVGETEIEFSEVHAEEKHESRNSKGQKRTHYTTIFRGIFMIADFHKNFHGETIVLPDSSEKFLGRWGRKLQKWNFVRDDLVVMENPEFEREFVVYGTDQVESRYIMTPDMMERFMALKMKNGKPIYASFKHSKIYLGVSIHSNLFESSFNKSLLDDQNIEEIINDLKFCFGIVEDLNLNTRIWTK